MMWFRIISTPFALANKAKAFLQEEKHSDQVIESFINENVGDITLAYDRQDLFHELIPNFNKIGKDVG